MGLWIKEEQPQVNLENLEQFISSNFTTAKNTSYISLYRKLGQDLIEQARNSLDYCKDKRSGLTLCTDQNAQFYRGKQGNKPVLMIVDDRKAVIFKYELGLFS